MAQVAHWSCEIPILGDVKNSSGHSAGESALDRLTVYSPFVVKFWKFGVVFPQQVPNKIKIGFSFFIAFLEWICLILIFLSYYIRSISWFNLVFEMTEMKIIQLQVCYISRDNGSTIVSPLRL